MNPVRNLVHEIHRRSLWQVLGVYALASWAVLQVVDTFTSALGLPAWLPPVSLGVLLVLLPVVMATAFVQEGDAGSRRRGTFWLVLVIYVVAAYAGYVLIGLIATWIGLPAWFPPLAGVLLIALLPVVIGTALVSDAREDEPGPTPSAESLKSEGLQSILTWRNVLLTAAGAFVVLGVLSGGYVAMWAMGVGPVGSLVAKGVLEAREPIILADFEDQAGDSLLALAATEALRTDLSRSSVVRVVESDYVVRALERMERDPTLPLSFEVAREVALREGLKAVIAGEVTAIGGRFVLSSRIVAAESGEVFWAHRESADSADIIEGIDRLSNRLRERVGESLVSIRAGQPLERVTTSSLEALRKYSQGVKAIEGDADRQRGAALLREAVALDSTFAMAYRKLVVSLGGVEAFDAP